jgi:biopolymer transport protein ExbD
MRRSRAALEGAVGELNLVPYMDIMTNLILFMLVSMTSFVDMRVVNVSTPSTCDHCGTMPSKDRALLVGIVADKGFFISVDGKMLEETPPGGLTVASLPGKGYDFEGLTAKLAAVKRDIAPQTGISLIPDRSVDYETVIKTMDALRRDRSGTVLFPDVSFGVQ